MNRIYILLLLISFFSNLGIAQNVSFEQVKELCNNETPASEKIKITVTRFSSRMNSAHNQLGSELATMLTNALYQVNCFNVLESANNMDDFDKEFEMKNKGYSNRKAPQKGKMLGAQVIITGEITEYAEGKKSLTFSGLSLGSNKAHVGFILKVLHAETREVLYSESINSSSKSNGFTGLSLLGFKVAGTENRSKALNNAIEKAIIKATELLGKSKDSWADRVHSNIPKGHLLINVIVINIDFTELLKFETILKSMTEVIDVSKIFESNTGTFNINFKGSYELLAMMLSEKIDNSLKITEVSDDYIILVQQ